MLLSGKRIFIVEDNAMNRVVYQMTLALEGARLEFDRWGTDAADKLRSSHTWDLIILDLMLARGLSGFEIFEEIRRIPHHQHTPILAISASEPEVAMPRARELGFSGFIAKPVDEALIVRQVLQVMNGESVWHAGTPYRHSPGFKPGLAGDTLA
jgi:CheY-like chemotaxis protein